METARCTPLPRAPRQLYAAAPASALASPSSPPASAAEDEVLASVTTLAMLAERPPLCPLGGVA
ncbi:hypothetical protein ABZ136_09610 [Streptomyces microflavus]|uniref:hypothetical protein n=1 Tax=Streptomyces microflavus TaxID=1919 RepID=UPI0033B3AF31